jgi:hypothetical protein
MSMVIDGADILVDNRDLALVMGRRLGDLLTGKQRIIPEGILNSAKKLFSVAVDEIRKGRGLELINKDYESTRRTYMTYKLVTDMLKKVKRGDSSSQLEGLAIALDALSSDGREIAISNVPYQILKDVFNEMYEISTHYRTSSGCHSPYSIGTFDDSDE